MSFDQFDFLRELLSARRAEFSRIRREARKQRSKDDEAPWQLEPFFTDGGIKKTERKILLDQLMRLLTEQQTELIKLFLEGYTQEEIGEKLQLTQGRISQIYNAAILRIRRSLRQNTTSNKIPQNMSS